MPTKSRTEKVILEYADFILELDKGGEPTVALQNTVREGALEEVRAHEHTQSLRVEYLAIEDIHFAQGGEFLEKKLEKKCFGVSYLVRLEFHSLDGALLFPKKKGAEETVRVSYWNLPVEKFFSLQFLRNPHDREKFILALKDPVCLFEIAGELAPKNSRLSLVAYSQGLLHAATATAVDLSLAALLNYSKKVLDSGLIPLAEQAIKDYRILDKEGVGILDLAHFVLENASLGFSLEEILIEGMERLMRLKPRFYSLGLCGILDIVLSENLTRIKSGELLWQTYLAAASERALPVLRELVEQAKEVGADQDTLDIIEKTWRGYSKRREESDEKRLT